MYVGSMTFQRARIGWVGGLMLFYIGNLQNKPIQVKKHISLLYSQLTSSLLQRLLQVLSIRSIYYIIYWIVIVMFYYCCARVTSPNCEGAAVDS